FPPTSVRQLGLMVLTSDQSPSLEQQWRGRELLSRFPGHPLARYLLPDYDPHLERRVNLGRTRNDREGFLHRLNALRALGRRLVKNQGGGANHPVRQADRKQALQFVHRNAGSQLGWAMLSLLADEGGGDEAFRREVTEAYLLFENLPGLGYAARYEYARG